MLNEQIPSQSDAYCPSRYVKGKKNAAGEACEQTGGERQKRNGGSWWREREVKHALIQVIIGMSELSG